MPRSQSFRAGHKVHAGMIHRWKKEALASMTLGFSGKQAKAHEDSAYEIKELHAKMGQWMVERDFLADASKRLGVWGGKKGSTVPIGSQCSAAMHAPEDQPIQPLSFPKRRIL